jgi:crossover junction endodeoxyribonuclease RuvC
MTGTLMHDWSSQEDRFDVISDHFIRLLKPSDVVLMEGYSYGSKGVVFHIGELTGLLKHKLWLMNIGFEVTPPSSIKKFATGKGNANKAVMNEWFVKKTGFDIRGALSLSPKMESPAADVVDAYFACALARHLKINAA